MRKSIIIQAFTLLLLGFSFIMPRGLCQESADSQKKKVEPLSQWSKQWLEEVVPYIITAAEKKAFLSLPTEEDRGRFIESFWRKRDPNPQTSENEYKNEYYKRIALANKFFGASGIAGWRTERGKIFILLGPPNEIQRDLTSTDPSSAAFHGPKESWNYYGLSNPYLPYNMEFTFVDKLGTGMYVLERSLRMGEAGATQLDTNSLRFQFDEMENMAQATKNPFDNIDKLKGIVTTQVSYDHIPLHHEMLSFKESEQKIFCPLMFALPFAALPLKKIEDKYYYSLTLVINAANDQGKIIFEGTRDINFKHTPAELESLREKTYQGQVFLSLDPAVKKIHLLVLDNFSGKMGTSDQNVSFPDYEAGDLIISDIVPYSPRKDAPEKGAEKGRRTFPQLNRVFRPGDELSVYFEVYNLALHPETGKNNFRVEYAVVESGMPLIAVPSPEIPPTGEKDCRIQTAFGLKNIKSGEYALRATVKDVNSGKSRVKETSFAILP